MRITSLLDRNQFTPYLSEARTAQTRLHLPTTAASWAVGYHVYLDLRLNLHIRAAGDTTNARRYLRILELYAHLVDLASHECGGRILEVQGERIHVLLDAEAVDSASFERLLSFASLADRLVHAHIKPEAGDDFQSLRQATDHGKAVLIVTGSARDDSVVSLGTCANEPAKRLNAEGAIPARNISVRRDWVDRVTKTDGRQTWHNIDLSTLPVPFQPYVDGIYLAARATTVGAAFQGLRSQLQVRDVRALDSGTYPSPGVFSVTNPMRLQAVAMRADLDGFTARVAEAFGSPIWPRAVVLLADEFLTIVKAADSVAEAAGRPAIRLPWAGDCANVLFLPKQAETYRSFLGYASVDVGHRWHAQECQTVGEWDVKWVVSVAGGDQEEGSNGTLLVATILLSGRSFLVAAGWGMGRSLDAHSASGVRVEDTIIPKCDYQMLDDASKGLFHELTTVFHASGRLKAHDPAQEAIAILGGAGQHSGNTRTHTRSEGVPPARPFREEGI